MLTLRHNDTQILESELPHALERMADMMDAGKSLERCMKIWSDTHPMSPLSAEFNKVVVANTNGMPFGKALEQVKSQTDSPALKVALRELMCCVQTGREIRAVLRDTAKSLKLAEEVKEAAKSRNVSRWLATSAAVTAAVALKRTF